MTLRITGGDFRGRRIRVPRSADLRPTSDRVRSAIFSILGQNAIQDARVLDLYAGTGALGIEALSRGAEWADFVEANARRAHQLRQNIAELSLGNRSKVYTGRVERVMASLPGGYSLVFADPPYAMDDWLPLVELLNRAEMMTQGCTVVLEHRSHTELADEYHRLTLVTTRRYGDTSVSIYRAGAIND